MDKAWPQQTNQTAPPDWAELERNYKPFMPSLRLVWERMQRKTPLLLAVDGRCGSGKTTLGEQMAQVFSGCVFHMDDFYLPMERRAPDWEQQPGGNMDFERFQQEILTPVKQGKPVFYRPFSCQTGTFQPEREQPPTKLVVVEGSYSLHPWLRPAYDAAIFVTCSSQVQKERLIKREGAHFIVFSQRWIPLEEQYFQQYNVLQTADLVADTTEWF